MKTVDVANEQIKSTLSRTQPDPVQKMHFKARPRRLGSGPRGLAGHCSSRRSTFLPWEVKSLKENLPQDNDDANDGGEWMKDG